MFFYFFGDDYDIKIKAIAGATGLNCYPRVDGGVKTS